MDNCDDIIPYDNAVTSQVIQPKEPRMFVLASGNLTAYDFLKQEAKGNGQDAEEVSDVDSNSDDIEDDAREGMNRGCIELFNFSQLCLDSAGIYMLDFTSEIIVWVGSTVKKHIMRRVF